MIIAPDCYYTLASKFYLLEQSYHITRHMTYSAEQDSNVIRYDDARDIQILGPTGGRDQMNYGIGASVPGRIELSQEGRIWGVTGGGAPGALTLSDPKVVMAIGLVAVAGFVWWMAKKR